MPSSKQTHDWLNKYLLTLIGADDLDGNLLRGTAPGKVVPSSVIAGLCVCACVCACIFAGDIMSTATDYDFANFSCTQRALL